MMGRETRSFSLKLFLPLFCLAPQLGFSATWSGYLVDARCFESAQDNHNVSDSPVLQDVGLEIRLCSPKAKTHSFAIVRGDGASLALDSTGNAKAAELIRHDVKKPQLVTVNGEMDKKKVIAVNSIEPVK
jgi:hypothetical protein